MKLLIGPRWETAKDFKWNKYIYHFYFAAEIQ